LARSLYVTALGPQSGKSIVALGLVEMLSARTSRIGFLRPVAPADPAEDPQLELIRRRYGIPAERSVSDADAHSMGAAGSAGELEKRVVESYRRLADGCDVVVCEGTDFAGAAPGLDFDLNARLANALGCPVLAVVRAASGAEAAQAVKLARESLDHKGCELFGVMVTRVPPAAAAEVSAALAPADGEPPVYVLEELPELAYPTVGEVSSALGAEVLFDPGQGMQREVREVRVAAMGVEHFIADLAEGSLVIVPGDRADILVASLASTLAPDAPAVAGVVLTTRYEPGPAVLELLRNASFPVLGVAARTYAVATKVHGLKPVLAPGDERKIASALGVFASGVDPLELEGRMSLERPRRLTPAMFEYELIERAKEVRQHVVLPEGGDDRVLRAADILLRRGVVDLTILGDPRAVSGRASALGLELSGALLVDPQTASQRDDYAGRLHELRKHRGMTPELAYETVADETWFATLMIAGGEADGMVSGATHTTADTIRPAFQVIRSRPGVSLVSSVFLMCMAEGVLVFGDCAVNPRPTVEELADIAISSAETAWSFGVEPRVAMLSYSSGESGKGPEVDEVKQATAIVRERRPDIPVDGPLQYDAAIEPAVAEQKSPDSEVAGRATVFIFPDLETGNISYKAVQRSSGAVAIGPVLQGLRSPVNDLSRGCLVPDIVNTVVITAIQAQEVSGRSTSRLQVKSPPDAGPAV
jgi:phosphate acetyltransferase